MLTRTSDRTGRPSFAGSACGSKISRLGRFDLSSQGISSWIFPNLAAIAPANYIFLSPGTPGDVAFKSMVAQLAQKRRQPAPAIEYTTVKQLPNDGQGGTDWLLVANVTLPSGPIVSWVEIKIISGPMAFGGFQMTVYTVDVPQALANQEVATTYPLFAGFKTNGQAVLGAINADIRTNNAIFKNAMIQSQKRMDASERSTTATTNYLLGQTVVSDGALNAHGTVSDDVANALMAADPNRFQSVSSGGYVKGIDY